MSFHRPITIQDILAYFMSKYNYDSSKNYVYRGHEMRVTIPAFWGQGTLVKYDDNNFYRQGYMNWRMEPVLFPMKNITFDVNFISLDMRVFQNQPKLDKDSELYQYLDSGMDEVAFLVDILNREETIEDSMALNSIYGHLNFGRGGRNISEKNILGTYVSSTNPELEEILKSAKTLEEQRSLLKYLDKRNRKKSARK